LPPQPLPAHRPERLACLAQHGQHILRRADQTGLDRADEPVVEQPLGLGADRLRFGTRRLELRDERAAFVQEREQSAPRGPRRALPARYSKGLPKYVRTHSASRYTLRRDWAPDTTWTHPVARSV